MYVGEKPHFIIKSNMHWNICRSITRFKTTFVGGRATFHDTVNSCQAQVWIYDALGLYCSVTRNIKHVVGRMDSAEYLQKSRL